MEDMLRYTKKISHELAYTLSIVYKKHHDNGHLCSDYSTTNITGMSINTQIYSITWIIRRGGAEHKRGGVAHSLP
jgi:hypothetical protein